ncbi:hypothetical protein KIPB_016987, partial [Kipferlia bialata]
SPIRLGVDGYSSTMVDGDVYHFGGYLDPLSAEVEGEDSDSDDAPSATEGVWLNDLHVYHPQTKEWHTVPKPAEGDTTTPWPSARSEHIAFSLNGMLVIAGGEQKDSVQDNTWVYDPQV